MHDWFHDGFLVAKQELFASKGLKAKNDVLFLLYLANFKIQVGL